MRVSSIILRVGDLDRAVAFWSGVVGLDVATRAAGFASLDGGALPILLSSIDEPISDESLTEVVFESDDVRRTYGEMAGRGVPFEGELRLVMSIGGRDLIAAHFRDPDGHYGTLSGWVASA